MSDEQDQHFMREALALADIAATLGEIPVGAVIVREGVIIARAHNRRELDQDPTAHAELLALRDAATSIGAWRLTGCRVYVTLEPCAMCMGAMILARVDACVFGCTDPKGGFAGTLADLSHWPGLNHHFDLVPGVLAAECSHRLRDFFRALRARPKTTGS